MSAQLSNDLFNNKIADDDYIGDTHLFDAIDKLVDKFDKLATPYPKDLPEWSIPANIDKRGEIVGIKKNLEREKQLQENINLMHKYFYSLPEPRSKWYRDSRYGSGRYWDTKRKIDMLKERIPKLIEMEKKFLEVYKIEKGIVGGRRKKKTRRKRGGMEEPEVEKPGSEEDTDDWSLWTKGDYLWNPKNPKNVLYIDEKDWNHWFREGEGYKNIEEWKSSNPRQVRQVDVETGQANWGNLTHKTAEQLYNQGWRIYKNPDWALDINPPVVAPAEGGGKRRKKKTRRKPIRINPKMSGVFTKKAKRKGMSVQKYAKYIVKKYKGKKKTKRQLKLFRQAMFAKTAKKWKKRRVRKKKTLEKTMKAGASSPQKERERDLHSSVQLAEEEQEQQFLAQQQVMAQQQQQQQQQVLEEEIRDLEAQINAFQEVIQLGTPVPQTEIDNILLQIYNLTVQLQTLNERLQQNQQGGKKKKTRKKRIK